MADIDLLRSAYGEEDAVGTVGKDTYGHNCLTSYDVHAALKAGGANLMYGELLPAGLDKMLDAQHLSVPLKAEASTGEVELVLELGMGTGKVAMQMWLERAVQVVIGVELAASRTVVGVEAMHTLCAMPGDRFTLRSDNAVGCIGDGTAADTADDIVAATSNPSTSPRSAVVEAGMNGTERRLEFRTGDMFDPQVLAPSEVRAARAVIIQTCVPSTLFLKLARLLMQISPGCKVVLFDSVETIWDHALAQQTTEDAVCGSGGDHVDGSGDDVIGAVDEMHGPIAQLCARVPALAPLQQLACNVDEDTDRFATSWSPTRGHHFHVYERIANCEVAQQPVRDEATSRTTQGTSAGELGTGKTFTSAGGVASSGTAPTEDAPARAARTIAVGTAVEVLYSWLPTDTEEVQMFDGTEQWFRGWVTGVQVDVGITDHQSDGQKAAQKPTKSATTYCVLYDDGDVEENVPGWRMRVPAEAKSCDDGDVGATVKTEGCNSLDCTPARPAGARLVVTPPPAPANDR